MFIKKIEFWFGFGMTSFVQALNYFMRGNMLGVIVLGSCAVIGLIGILVLTLKGKKKDMRRRRYSE